MAKESRGKLSKNTVSKALAKSEELGQNATPQDEAELEKNLPAMRRGVMRKAWDKVLFLWEKARSPDVPVRLKVTIVGALLYLVLPIDVIPDSLPGLGLIDDLSVILIVFREVSRYVLPKIEKKAEEKAYDFCYQKIDATLRNVLFAMIANTLWTFVANVIGCVVLVKKPFGMPSSRYAAAVLFLVIFGYTLVRLVIYLKKYGRATVKITAAVFRTRSVSKGIAQFVKTEYKYIGHIYAGISFAKNFIPEIPRIPDLDEIIKTFEKHYKKRVLLVAVVFVLYTALVWGTKVLLMRGA